jgi:hypothetical protein
VDVSRPANVCNAKKMCPREVDLNFVVLMAHLVFFFWALVELD